MFSIVLSGWYKIVEYVLSTVLDLSGGYSTLFDVFKVIIWLSSLYKTDGLLNGSLGIYEIFKLICEFTSSKSSEPYYDDAKSFKLQSSSLGLSF